MDGWMDEKMRELLQKPFGTRKLSGWDTLWEVIAFRKKNHELWWYKERGAEEGGELKGLQDGAKMR